jgi:hypothetical protein
MKLKYPLEIMNLCVTKIFVDISFKIIIHVQNKSSISLGVEAKPDPGNQQRETEAKKLALENTEKILKASESSVSDQSGSDNVLKANIHDRYCPISLLHAIFLSIMALEPTHQRDTK